MLEIAAENLGPLRKGAIKLKPLTVFVGPSNSGKSVMAAALHALIRAFHGSRLLPPNRHYVGGHIFTDQTDEWDFWGIPEEDSLTETAVKQWAKNLYEMQLDPENLIVADMPEEVRTFLIRSASEALDRVSAAAQERLRQVLGEPWEFVNKAAREGEFRLALIRDEPRLYLNIVMAGSPKSSPDFDISGAPLNPSPIVLSPHRPPVLWGGEPVGFYDVFLQWARAVSNTILSDVPDQSFYLPAARSGIVQGYKILGAELVRRSPGMGGQWSNTSTLPGTTADFLGNLISIDRRMLRHRIQNTELQGALSFIENHVMRGRVDLDESLGFASSEIVYMPTIDTLEGEKFTLDRTSSMVSELAPLILFLRYLVNESDLLILEEPESHLHPSAQRQMARGIVRLVNSGVKVLITTHSDYFLNQLNNLIRISNANDLWLEDHEFERADCLERDDVSAYVFHWDENQGGSLIEELTIRPDVGIDDDEFGKVVNDQYEETILVEGIPLK